MSCNYYYSMTLAPSAVGWTTVFDYDTSWSCSLTLIWHLMYYIKVHVKRVLLILCILMGFPIQTNGIRLLILYFKGHR